MVLAIEYTRASTDHQEYSVGDQSKYNHEWAKRNHYKIIKTYADDGISGGSVAKRPGFLAMIEDITTGRLPDVKVLLIWDSFRFARNMVEFLTYKQMIRQHGITVIAVTEPIVEDEDAQLYIDAINGASGELYLRKLSKDSKRGIRSKVVNRHEHLGFAPFGYRMDRNAGHLVICEEEAHWVRWVFQSVIDGMPVLQIADALGKNNVLTRRGNKWTSVQLRYMITNKTYCGLLEVNLDGQHGIYDGNQPVIIDRETFDQVQQIMAERQAKHKPFARGTNRRVHWLSGLLRCPYCGGSLSFAKGHGGRADRYRCNNRQNGRGCENRSITISMCENIVLDKLQEIYTCPEVLCTLNITAVKPVSTIDYASELKKLRGQLTRAKKAYMEEIDTLEEYRENKAKITSAIAELEEKQAEVDTVSFDPAAFQDKCLSALSILRSPAASTEEKSAVSHNLIEKIVADGVSKELTIYFYS